jgi:hypothetical protein
MRIDASGNVGIGTSSPSTWSGSNLVSYFAGGNNFAGVTAINSNSGSGIGGIQFGSDATYVKAAIGLIRQDANGKGSIVFYNDSNADAANWSTGDEKMRIDSAGNVGIGTSSPATKFHVVGNSLVTTNSFFGDTSYYAGLTGSNPILGFDANDYMLYDRTSNFLQTVIGGTERMRINSSGNVSIGTSNAAGRLFLSPATGQAALSITGNLNGSLPGTNGESELAISGNLSAGNGEVDYIHNNSTFTGTNGGHRFIQRTGASTSVDLFRTTQNLTQFYTGGTERIRIDSDGNLLVGSTNSAGKIFGLQTSNNWAGYFENTNASVTNGVLALIGARNTTNNSWKAIVYYNSGAAQDRFIVQDSGNVQNINNSYGAISDVKLKENIVDASPKLADLCKVKVRQYNFKSNPEHKQIGVVAQELEEVFSGLVEEQKDQDIKGNDLGTTTKSVKYSVFVPMLIKAIQEQQTLIENLTTRLTALENK